MSVIDCAGLAAWSVSNEMLDWFNLRFPSGAGAYQDVLDAMAWDDYPAFAHLLLNCAGPDEDGLLEIDGSASRQHVFAAGRLIVHGEIRIDGWVRAGLTIQADNNVRAGLGVIAGWSIWVGGSVHSERRIKASTRIDAGENIEAGQTIWSGCAIVAGGNIHSRESILVGKDDRSDSPYSHHWDADLDNVFRENKISFTNKIAQIGNQNNRCNALLVDCTSIGLSAGGDIAAGDCISCATTIKATENITAGRAILAGRSIEAGDNIIVGKSPLLEWQPCLQDGLESDHLIRSTSICGKSGVDNAPKKRYVIKHGEQPFMSGTGISVGGDIWCDGKIRGDSITVRGSVFAARYVAAVGDIIVGKTLIACERIQGASVFAGWGAEAGDRIVVDRKAKGGHKVSAKSSPSSEIDAHETRQVPSEEDGLGFDQKTAGRPLQGIKLDMSDINVLQKPSRKQSELSIFKAGNARPLSIKVIGVGGAGGNVLDFLVSQDLEGIELIATNTDAQALARCNAGKKLLLGDDGLAAGGDPSVGCRAADHSREQIAEILKGADLVFIVAGLGGGTGTGAGPVIANIANELRIFTIALVTHPFEFEGERRRSADVSIAAWEKELSSLIVLSQDRIVEAYDAAMSMDGAFRAINQLYFDAIRGIAAALCFPSLVNMTGGQVCVAMAGLGTMCSGIACGADRARIATERALSLQLSNGGRISGGKRVLLIVTAARGLKQKEVSQVISAARSAVASGTKLFLGTAYDDTLSDNIAVTGFAIG